MSQVPLFDERQGPPVAPVQRVADGGLVMYRVAGRMYPMHVEPKCKTCNSPYRTRVEEGLLVGYGYTAIVKTLPPDANLSAKNITNHVENGHLPTTHAVRQAVIQERARERGIQIESAVGSVVDHIALARLAVQRAYEDIASGRLRVGPRDAAVYAELLHKHGQEAGSEVDQEALTQAFMAYMAAAQRVMDADQMREFAQLLRANPILRALLGRTAKTVDVDEVDEPPEPDTSALVAEAEVQALMEKSSEISETA